MNKKTRDFIFKHKFDSLFWALFLLAGPFIYSTQISDEDNLPKLVFLSAIMLILSIRSIAISTFRSFDKSIGIISLVIAIYFTFSFIRADNFSSGITALFTLLLPLFLLLLMRANKLFKSEIIYFFLPVAAIVLCMLAIGQYILMPAKDHMPVYLVRATMSNKNFLSEALVLYLVMIVAGIINSEGFIRKLNLTALVLVLLTILLLQTLSAYLCIGFLILIGVPLFIILFTENHLKIKIITRFLITGVIVSACFIYFGMRTTLFRNVKDKIEYSVNVLTGKPLPQLNDGRQNSIYERLYLWKNSMKLFSESPVTGIGLSNWQIYWPKYGMQGASYLDAAIMRYEHPHNEYILLLTESGVAGVLCYAFFYCFIFFTGMKFLFSNSDNSTRKIVFIMSAGLICMGILSFFGYPVHRPYTIALCMLLCLFILESNDKLSVSKKYSGQLPPVLLLIFSLMSLNIFGNRLKGEYYFTRALKMQANQNFSGMLRMIRIADNKYYTTDNSSTPLDWYKGFAMFYQGNDSAMYYYQMAESQNHYHVQTLSDIGALLENQGKHEEAIAYFNKVIAFVPGYYQAHYNLAVSYFNLGKPVLALKEINARTNIGYEYLNTLDVILARNAELAEDSCDNTGKFRSLTSDKLFLRKINTTAMKENVEFRILFCDSITARLNKEAATKQSFISKE